ncbi:MAG: ABC transporter permease [Anaerolineae bacterium]
MKKLWVLAFKEIKLAFRDVGAIVTMLVTPLALTLAIGAAFGVGGSNTLSDIPVLLLNQDDGEMSQVLEEALAAEEVADLLALEVVTDEVSARARVSADEVAALVVIPPDFSARAVPLVARVQETLGIDLLSLDQQGIEALSQEQQQEIRRLYLETRKTEVDPVVVEIYASPRWRISTAVVKGLVTQVLERMNMTTQGTMVIIEQLFTQTALRPEGEESSREAFSALGEAGLDDAGKKMPVRVETVAPGGRGFNWLDYSATSMAVLFLMFAVTSGGRTLLAEREEGTLPRLLVSPTPAFAILAGKMSGIFLTGLLQVILLWGATTLLGAYWGPPPGVLAAIVALVLCATGVGALISAWARNAGQAGAIGTAVTLVASAFSGAFFPRMNLPEWVQYFSLITPNAWGIEIFSALQAGKGLIDVAPLIGGALALAALYYLAALPGFRHQFR